MSMVQILLRGMLAGLVAGFLAVSFATVYGEPQVERSIAFESVVAQAKGEAEEPPIWSRQVQASVGLLTGVGVVGVALGGIFALMFAICYGRFTGMSPRAFAGLLALICFATISLVPDLKYPANPPAVGEADTIGIRTALYFSMIGLSIIATIAAFSLRRVLLDRFGDWNASVLGLIAYVIMIGISFYALPVLNEVPETFPAQTLWTFRVASLGVQAILWSVIGLVFGFLTERKLAPRARAPGSGRPLGERHISAK